MRRTDTSNPKGLTPEDVGLETYVKHRPTAFDARGLNAARMGNGQRAGEVPCLDCNATGRADGTPGLTGVTERLAGRLCESCNGTGVDHDDTDRSAWYVAPLSITRDTPDGSLDASNFASLESELLRVDPAGRDHERHSFGHWGPGWYDIIIVRPTLNGERTAALDSLIDVVCALESYPVLDDDDYSRRQCEAEDEAWGNYLADDIKSETKRLTGGIINIDDCDSGDVATVIRYMGAVENDDEGPHVDIRGILTGAVHCGTWSSRPNIDRAMDTMRAMLAMPGAYLVTGDEEREERPDGRSEYAYSPPRAILSRRQAKYVRRAARFAALPRKGR